MTQGRFPSIQVVLPMLHMIVAGGQCSRIVWMKFVETQVFSSPTSYMLINLFGLLLLI